MRVARGRLVARHSAPALAHAPSLTRAGSSGSQPPGNRDVWSALIFTYFPVHDLIHAFAEYALCPCASFLGAVNMITGTP